MTCYCRAPPADRGRILFRIAHAIREVAEELATLESRDNGKPLRQSRTDVQVAARYFEFFGGIAERAGAQVERDAGPGFFGRVKEFFAFLSLLEFGLIGVFLLTALFGRAWCGWACPQTVYMEFLFRPIERLFEGGRSGSMELDRAGQLFIAEGEYITRRLLESDFSIVSLFVEENRL